jgi:hypothetical protein
MFIPLPNTGKGCRRMRLFTRFPFRVHILPETLLLFMNIDLDGIFRGDQALEVGISAVIKHGDGMMSYWSLFHPGPQADFHCRDGFLIEL